MPCSSTQYLGCCLKHSRQVILGSLQPGFALLLLGLSCSQRGTCLLEGLQEGRIHRS
jgi:hypothetical protein